MTSACIYIPWPQWVNWYFNFTINYSINYQEISPKMVIQFQDFLGFVSQSKVNPGVSLILKWHQLSPPPAWTSLLDSSTAPLHSPNGRQNSACQAKFCLPLGLCKGTVSVLQKTHWEFPCIAAYRKCTGSVGIPQLIFWQASHTKDDTNQL